MGIVIDPDRLDIPGPILLTADTENLYLIPGARPSMTQDFVPLVSQEFPPGTATTLYPMILDPPERAGFFQATRAFLP